MDLIPLKITPLLDGISRYQFTFLSKGVVHLTTHELPEGELIHAEGLQKFLKTTLEIVETIMASPKPNFDPPTAMTKYNPLRLDHVMRRTLWEMRCRHWSRRAQVYFSYRTDSKPRPKGYRDIPLEVIGRETWKVCLRNIGDIDLEGTNPPILSES